MSEERTLGREPVQVVEVIVPKCANVHGSAPCAALQTGNGKCFNTRATCNDVDNYQARPLSFLTPDLLLNSGDTIDAASIDFTADALIEVDLRFRNNPTGTIFAVGSASNFLYLGITAGELVFAAGGTTAADQARIAIDPAALIGRTVTLIAEVDYSNDAVRLYEFDPIELELTLLGEAAAGTALPAAWAGSTDGEVGDDSGISYGTEDGGAYSGTITTARVHSDQTADLFPSQDRYRERYFFDDGRKARPADPIYILPMVTSVQTVGSRINLTGVDGRYEPLGRRAFADIMFADAPHSDHPFDPYRTERTYDPLKQSTFWAKWMRRHQFGKTRAIVRLYAGYDGQTLAQMRRQTYVLDAVDWQREATSMRCRDFLSLTEFRRAQVPATSPGRLEAVLTDVATSLTLVGDVTDAYPSSGTLRIGDEIMTYSGVSYDGFTDNTTISSLTRGSDGSEAQEHDIDEGVQLCRRYTAARVDEVLEDLILNDAEVPAQVVDLEGLFEETEDNLLAYQLTTLISESTGVDQLIGEIAEQCSFYVWWDERDQIVRFQAIKPLSSVAKTFDQDIDIIADTFQIVERPKERITTISAFYNPRNFAGDLTKPVNFRNQILVSNSTASGPDQYGDLPQTREIFSRWLTTNAQLNQTLSRYSVRYAQVPQYVQFMVDAKDREIWVGDFISISHEYFVDARGNRDIGRRWLVIEAKEVEPGHTQMLHCVDVTLDGLIYVITENGIGTYTPELFLQGNGFITRNDGLNIDGSVGATIG
jgi:hypothetical protein